MCGACGACGTLIELVELWSVWSLLGLWNSYRACEAMGCVEFVGHVELLFAKLLFPWLCW